MTAIVNSDGTIAEDSIDTTEAHPLPELYSLCSRDLKNVSYAVADETEDPDAKKWAKLQDSLQIEGHDLGALQGSAVKIPLNQYMERHGYSAVPTEQATGWERRLLEKGNVLQNMTGNTWWEDPGHIQVPVSKSGDKLPVVVLSNEASEKAPTFEEAKEILWDTLDRIPEFSKADVESENDTTNEDEPSSEDTEEGGLLRGAPGVGESVSDDIREYIVENRVTVDYRDHIDAEEWHEAPTLVSDEEAEERLEAVYGEAPPGVYDVAKDEVEDGSNEKAMKLISDFE